MHTQHILIHFCVVYWWCKLLMDRALEYSSDLTMLWNIDVSLMADVQLRWTGMSKSALLSDSRPSPLPFVYLFIPSHIGLFLRKKSVEAQGRTDRHVTVNHLFYLCIAPWLYFIERKVLLTHSRQLKGSLFILPRCHTHTENWQLKLIRDPWKSHITGMSMDLAILSSLYHPFINTVKCRVKII